MKTKSIPAYLVIGKSDERMKMGKRKKAFPETKNSNNKKTRTRSNPMKRDSDMKPEKVSTINGDTAMKMDVKKPAKGLFKALLLKRPERKTHIMKEIMAIHLAVNKKSPFRGVSKLTMKGKKGGNSVTGVKKPFELRITDPLPAWIFRAALR